MNRGLNPGLGLALLRITLGVIFFAHGWAKIGGTADLATYLGSLGVPAAAFNAWIVLTLELAGGILLVLGFAVVPVALLLAFQMIVGIFLVHVPNGFFVIGPGQNGFEFNLLLAVALLVLVFVGRGHWAIQNRFQKDVITS